MRTITPAATMTVVGRFSLTAGTPTATGPGWTATRTGTGAYTIQFVPPFGGTPSVSVVAYGGSSNVLAVVGGSWSPALVAVAVFLANTAAAQDWAVMFTATGPRALTP